MRRNNLKTGWSQFFCLALVAVPLTFTAPNAGAQIQFQDVTAAANVAYTGESYGASWGDLNSDGLIDLFVNHHRNTPSNYVNMGDGSFEDRWFEVAFWRQWPHLDQHGAALADFDNDGDEDVFVSLGATDNSQFLVNNGHILQDRTLEYAFDDIAWSGRLPVWFDFSRDGYLDFGLANRGGFMQLLEQLPGQLPADSFARRNGISAHNCHDNQYMQLADLDRATSPGLGGELELICAGQEFYPDQIKSYAATTFIDLNAGVPQLLPTEDLVVDSLLADFDGNGENDILLIGGRQRVSGAALNGTDRVEAHLINDVDSEMTLTFVTAGDLSFELFWNARDPFAVHIGATGWDIGSQPGEPGVVTPLLFDILASGYAPENDPNGIQPHDPLTDNGVYIGMQVDTPSVGLNTWTVQLSPGNQWNYTYFLIDSSASVTDVAVAGLTAGDHPIAPLLYLNNGGVLTDSTVAAGLDDPMHCVGGSAGDFDNDMDIDLFLVCRGAVDNTIDRLYENTGGGVFTQVTGFGAEGPTGMNSAGNQVGLGENSVVADYDADGFLDLFVMNGLKLYPEPEYGLSGPDKLYKNDAANQGNTNNWVQFDLQGTTANRDGVGAKVYVTTEAGTANEVMQLREQNGGYHRWSQDTQRLHFGLGSNTSFDVEVHWPGPSTQVDTFTGVAAGSVYIVIEGDDAAVPAEPGTILPLTIPTSVAPTSCHEPVYDKATEAGVWLWQDCDTGIWQMWATGGGGNFVFEGDIVSDQDFATVVGNNIEAADLLDASTDPSIINFSFEVAGNGTDGVEFTYTAGSNVCMLLNNPPGQPVYVGHLRSPLTGSFNLDTMGPCTNLPPVISVDDVSIAEGDLSAAVTFTVELSAASAETVSVVVETRDGTAVDPDDYLAVAQTTLTFNPGVLAQPVVVNIVDDTLGEGNEEFTLRMSSPINALLPDASATATILDDENDPCGEPVYDRATEQGVFLWKDCATGLWSARMTAGGQEVSYQGNVYAPTAYTSVAGFSVEGPPNDVLDFTSDPAIIEYQLYMAGGGQDGFDFLPDADAGVCFTLNAPVSTNVYLGSSRTPVTPPFDLSTLASCSGAIPPTISIADVSVDENDVGGVAVFTLSLSETSAETVTVFVESADGSASAPDDYTAVALSTISFAPTEISKTLDVPIVNDMLAEGDQDFTLTLSNPVNGVLGATSTVTATIVDDEATPCGQPSYDRATEQGVFLWKDCSSGSWFARMTGGGSSLTYSGNVFAQQAFASVTPFSVEGPPDVLDFTTDPAIINFSLGMSGSGQDGFDFTTVTDADVCFDLDLPVGMPIYVGVDRTVVAAPFDLSTLAACGTAVPPTITVADLTVDENDPLGVASFIVSLSQASADTVTVFVESTDGTASAPEDYTAVSLSTISFTPSEVSKAVDVVLVDDSLAEGDQDFSLTLSTPVNAVLGTASTATATIVDDEVSPCGQPIYDRATEQGVFLWQDCGSGEWFVRMTGGGGSLTYAGNVFAQQAFSSVIAFSIEGSPDVLDFTTDPAIISFSLGMSGSGQDGFDFKTPTDAGVCFDLDLPAAMPIYVGADRVLVAGPFELSTLATCSIATPPAISIASLSVDENAVGGIASITLSLSEASANTVTVFVDSADGTAIAPDDYTAVVATSVSFAPSETSKTVDVAIVDDSLAEGDEDLTLTLSAPVNGILGDATAQLNIVDDELSPCGQPTYDKATEQGVFLWKDCSSGTWMARMTGGGGTVAYEGSLFAQQDFSSVLPVSVEGADVVDYTSDPSVIVYELSMSGSGQDGFDFTTPGDDGVCFTLDLPVAMPIYVGEDRNLVAEPFELSTLAACSTAPPPSVSVADVSVAENDAGGVASFTVSLSEASADTVTVFVESADGSASAPDDYTALALSTISFDPAEVSRSVEVPIVDDALAEGDQSFSLTLSAPVNAVLGQATATATIVDDEPSPCGQPVYDKASEQGVFLWKDCSSGAWMMRTTGGGAASTVTYDGRILALQDFGGVTPFSLEGGDTLDNTTDASIIDFELSMSGTGQDGFDFTTPSDTGVCFTLDLPVAMPIYLGADRTLVAQPFELSTLGGCSIVLPPSVSIDDVSVNENDASGVASFTISLSEMSADRVTVFVESADGSASAPDDYAGVVLSSVSFAPSEISKTLDVAIVDDALAEGSETFSVALSSPVNAELGNAVATATIIDDEVSPCGQPAYDRATEQAVFLWKDCSSGEWFVRMTGGTVSAVYEGDVSALQAYSGVTGFSIEASDMLDFTTDPAVIDFNLIMGVGGQDGFNFTTPTDVDVCFSLNSPAVPVYVGAARTAVNQPFDLSTMVACTP